MLAFKIQNDMHWSAGWAGTWSESYMGLHIISFRVRYRYLYDCYFYGSMPFKFIYMFEIWKGSNKWIVANFLSFWTSTEWRWLWMGELWWFIGVTGVDAKRDYAMQNMSISMRAFNFIEVLKGNLMNCWKARHEARKWLPAVFNGLFKHCEERWILRFGPRNLNLK